MAQKPQEYFDGFGDFSSGLNSGIAPLLLPKNQLSFCLNTTVRGRLLTHRPPYKLQKLILDSGVDLTGQLFQGATYYDPDFGSESIVSQIGGRTYQFVPDNAGNVYVYDRSVKVYENGAGFTTKPSGQNIQYSLVVQNVTDVSGTVYPEGTSITNDPSFQTTSLLDLSLNSICGATSCTWQANLTLQPNYQGASALVGKKVFIGQPGNINSWQWSVTGSGTSNGNPTIEIFLTLQGNAGGKILIPAGSLVLLTTNPTPPNILATTSSGFTSPSVGSNATILIGGQYGGSVGDYVLISGSIYNVISVPQPTISNSSVVVQNQINTSLQFTYDLNPAGIQPVWMWQSENYVIINDGESRPLFFNGTSTRRSTTPTFSGSLAESFSLPQIGQPINLTFSEPFLDAAGTFIQISPLDYYSFLMEVVAVNVGGNQNVVTAVNITGQSLVNTIIPISTPVISTSTPSYVGVLTSNFVSLQMPAQGGSVQMTVSPAFNGQVGDSILLTDGTGPLTEYEFTVTAITAGGAGITATNVSAPQNLLIAAGYPVISVTSVPNELPPGRMGAYVQGRNWISGIDGKSFIASDQVGDSTGTQALNFRDAVLKWNLNTTKFAVPGGAGEINCIIALSALDASLGQGPLQILCDNDIFTCSAPSDATTWASLTTPIIAESIIGFGGTGQDAAVVSNGDLILKSSDGTIHSLKLSRQDFNQWGNMPISQEVNRVIKQENLNLLNFLSFGIADNRCLASCAPIESAGGVYSQGIIALDFDVTGSLQGKLPSVYDGVWKDLNLLKIVTGKFNKLDRAFAFNLNATTNTVELWEILTEGTADDDGSGTPRPITWSGESPLIFNDVKDKGEFDLVQLKDGELYVSNLTGEATIKVFYRPDFSECWHLWVSGTVVNKRPEPSYMMRAGLGEPTSSNYSDALNSTPATVARFYQIRIEITGSLTFCGAKFRAVPFVENTPARVLCD